LNDKDAILKEIKQAVLEVDPNAEVILFGSRARGDFHEESDWDVLILVNRKEVELDFKKKIRKALLQVELKFDQAITGIVRNKLFWDKLKMTPLYWEVQKDGLIL
jgi:predicted nucleotidyltransferase